MWFVDLAPVAGGELIAETVLSTIGATTMTAGSSHDALRTAVRGRRMLLLVDNCEHLLNTLEQSWGGLCAHVREGWNIGKPCYGYRAKTFRHPNPAKAARGHTKTRLEPDTARAETVAQIAACRYHDGIGYDTIAERLNTDPSSGCGHRSRPTPLIAKWMFDELQARRAACRGSREGNEPNTHPLTRRTYLLRLMLFCACGRRMFGNHSRNNAYYTCWPRNNNSGRPDRFETPPQSRLHARTRILDAVTAFYTDRVFGPHRRDILAAELAGLDHREARDRDNERQRLRCVLNDLDRRQNAVLRQAQDGNPDDPFTVALRGSYNDLEQRKPAARVAIAALDATDAAAATSPSPSRCPPTASTPLSTRPNRSPPHYAVLDTQNRRSTGYA